MATRKVFISYRRDDARADAGRLYDRLHARRVQATKAIFGSVTRVLKKRRGWLPGPVERAGRRVFKLVGR